MIIDGGVVVRGDGGDGTGSSSDVVRMLMAIMRL